MKEFVIAFLLLFLAGVFEPVSLRGNEFKEREAKITQYKKWLDTLGPQGSQYWTRLDARQRPHRLYLGEGFYSADLQSQERRYVFELSCGAPGKVHADRPLRCRHQQSRRRVWIWRVQTLRKACADGGASAKINLKR